MQYIGVRKYTGAVRHTHTVQLNKTLHLNITGADTIQYDIAGGVQYIEEYGEDVYGRVLYDFKAESERDLDMVEGNALYCIVL